MKFFDSHGSQRPYMLRLLFQLSQLAFSLSDRHRAQQSSSANKQGFKTAAGFFSPQAFRFLSRNRKGWTPNSWDGWKTGPRVILAIFVARLTD